jgi:hypothetical protein
MVERVVLAASPATEGGAARSATYTFLYNTPTIQRGPYSTYPNHSTVRVPQLTGILLPDGSAYGFTYNTTGTEGDSGALSSMSVPTGGLISYTYQYFETPTDGCSHGSWTRFLTGVGQRTLSGPGIPTATWTYSRTLNRPPNFQVLCDVHDILVWSLAPPEEMITAVTDPGGNVTEQYYSVWPDTDPTNQTNPDGFLPNEYSYPFTHKITSGGYLLSTRTYTAAGYAATTKSPLRSVFVKYDKDDLGCVWDHATAACQNDNRRLTHERTVYHDDGDRVADTEFTDFDGVGHFRSTELGGTFPAGNRTIYTAYNKISPSVNPLSTNPNALDTGTYPSGFALPATTHPWVLDTAPYVTITEGASIISSLACFDATTGALKRRRFLANSAGPGAHDLISDYTRNAFGNITDEYSFGGDSQTVFTDALCSSGLIASGDSAEYHVKHEYQYGQRSKSSFLLRASQTEALRALDTDIDRNTGLTVASRDPAGLVTTYEYDNMGHVTKSIPPGATYTTYTYQKAAGDSSNFLPAKVTATTIDAEAGSVTSEYDFDAIGRLHQEKRLMPDNTWSTQETNYDPSNRKMSVSELEATPTHYTSFSYDAFDRPTQVTAPDGSIAAFSYPAGVEQIVSSSKVRTSAASSATASETPVVKTEYHDRFGRISAVEENSGPTSTASPVGAIVRAEYTYDAADRLTFVKMTGTEAVQNRIFTYDGRGFLLWESQPESGMTAFTHDSRGNVLSTSHGAANTLFDLNSTYDSAGRLVRVDGRNYKYDPASTASDRRQQFLKIKEFTYADANGTTNATPSVTDYRKGRLWKATRYNYPPEAQSINFGYLGADIYRVLETYEYGDAAGRRTKRTTTIDKGTSVTDGDWSSVRTVDQSVSYNGVGLPKTLAYPSCQGCVLPWENPLRNVTLAYTEGRLSSVPSYVNSITYWPNGMRNQLVHSNLIADTQTLDAAIGRPAALSSGLYSACEAPVITSEPVGGTITTNTPTVTMTVSATGALSYQWYTANDNAAVTGATASSLTVNPASTRTYYVAVVNACRNAFSRVVTVSVNACLVPSVSAPSAKLNPDKTVTLHAIATGTEPLSYSCYRTSDNALVGVTATVTTGPISATTSYTIKVSSGCTSTQATATVEVPIALPAPALLTATKTAVDQITISWSAVPGATTYRLQRRNGAGWQDRIDINDTQFVDPGLPLNTTYAYRVFAGSDPARAFYSNVDMATTMTFTLAQSGAVVSFADFDRLLLIVNAVRTAAGWPAVTWQNIIAPTTPLPAPNVVILSQHLTSLRARMNEALQALGAPISGYTDADPQQRTIKALHINELQLRAQ